MIKYPPVQPFYSDIDDALRVMIKIVVYVYLIISGTLALVVGVVIVGMMASYVILRFIIRILAMLLHKHTGFSLRDALYSLLQQTQQYSARQGA